ncbi:Lipocalin-like domain-containing protein [bacterium A37T11]|nr:Lipocalin-like domain-containing protein [bacterium A37T11]
MKKSITLLSIGLVSSALFWSCSKNDDASDPDDFKSLIVGTWKGEKFTSTTYTNGVKTNEDVDTDLDDYIITFNADGSADYEDDEPAHYQIDGNKLTIYESDDPDDTDVLTIFSITKTQLIFKDEEEDFGDGKTYKYVEEDILTRVK